jgi:hypothetical protein
MVEYLREPNLPPGWASLAVLLMVLSGVQLFALGMIGEYLGRLFLRDNLTPMYVTREMLNCERSAAAQGQAPASNPGSSAASSG